ncbi:MAG: aminotransferase class V-fold PLP-dependent enzyme [Gemmatimonadota bacterium]
MERRSFFKTFAASLAAAGLLPELANGLNDELQALAADIDASAPAGGLGPAPLWGRVRQEFQLNPGLVHLNCGSIGATPRLVVEAVCNYLHRIEGNPLGNTWGGIGAGMEEARARAADFLGASLDEMAFTRNTTEGMNAVAEGIDWQPGDQVLTTNHEHGGGMACWQHLRKHRGVEVVCLKMPKTVRGKGEVLELIEGQLTRRTRVCSFMHLDTISGLVMPMADIAAITRPRGILLVCDGAQVPGMLKVDVKALGVDSYASSSHKWMLAPKGSGLLYIRKEVQDRIHPTFLYDGYHAYTGSSGTRNVANVLGHGLAVDFHNAIGRERVEARCRQLNGYLRDQLDTMPELVPLIPRDPELWGGICTYALNKGRNGDIVGRLSHDYQILLKPAQGTYAYVPDAGSLQENYNAIRFSTHIFNCEADLDMAVERLRQVMAQS